VAAKTRAVVDEYLKEMGVPAKYADVMFAVPKDEMKWVDIDSFNADLEGFTPELKDWVGARCDKLTSSEKAIWNALPDKPQTAAEELMAQALLKKKSEQFKCELDLQDRLCMTAYRDADKAGKLK
jgi:hypothetical protein